MKIAAERLQAWVARVFANGGMPALDAETVARVLVWANLRGMDTHGVVRVPRYMEWLRSGELNARPSMTTRNEAAACVLLEADRAAGPVAMTFASELATQKAKAAGIGLCLVRGTTHTAALGYYTQTAAEAGMAAIAFSASGPNMAYHGARAAGVSTAPLALAVPGEHGPVALDMASGVVSLGRLALARRSNETLQPGWALDGKGQPTTDPREAKLPLPLGGPKGSGLSLLIECLTSLLAGNPLLAEVLEGTPQGKRHRQNGAVIALDVARFVEPRQFAREVARLARAIKALPAQPGEEILLPGERGARAAAQRGRDGIPLPGPVLEELRALARSLNMEELS
jgi:LDH2 family malate/lactate/ureidoglycolate dehydrogenase